MFYGNTVTEPGFIGDLTMEKELSEMTLVELRDLLPIFHAQHDDQWNEYCNEIASAITDLLAGHS